MHLIKRVSVVGVWSVYAISSYDVVEVDIPPVATTHREDDQLSPVEHEFVSDMIPETQLSDEEMKQMQMQGKSTTSQQQKATSKLSL